MKLDLFEIKTINFRQQNLRKASEVFKTCKLRSLSLVYAQSLIN